MRVNNNVTALMSYNSLNKTDNAISKNLEKLSTGLRINRASDDAAGLSISEKMRAQIGGMNKAVQNAQDGISLVQTAEGALSEIHSILQRMNELTVQAANGTNNSGSLANIQAELAELVAEVDNIATKTSFNGIELLDGSLSGAGSGIKLQIGADAADNNLEINIKKANQSGLGINGLSVTSGAATIASGISKVQKAIDIVSSERANLGAKQNRLEHTMNNLNIGIENLTAAESRIRDVDMAQEMAQFTKNQILMQAGTSMLAQANSKPQAVLSLLGQ